MWIDSSEMKRTRISVGTLATGDRREKNDKNRNGLKLLKVCAGKEGNAGAEGKKLGNYFSSLRKYLAEAAEWCKKAAKRSSVRN